MLCAGIWAQALDQGRISGPGYVIRVERRQAAVFANTLTMLTSSPS